MTNSGYRKENPNIDFQKSIIRFEVPDAGKEIFLSGELTAWNKFLALDARDGIRYTDLELPTGVFRYKFKESDENGANWILDPNNPRTVSYEGAENSVAVIDGTAEPVIHAPGRPFLWRDGSGLVHIRALLRKEAGERLVLCWNDREEGFFVRDPMRLIAVEDQHGLFESILPDSKQPVTYYFEVPGEEYTLKRGKELPYFEPFRIFPPALAFRYPSWWSGAVLYSVFIDRFRRGDLSEGELTDPLARYGGDFRGIVRSLDYLAGLGVNALYLTPIRLSMSSHRYDAHDFAEIDPALGGREGFLELLDAAHAKGLKVLLDLSFNHVRTDYPAFRDVLDKQQGSEYADWFAIQQFPVSLEDSNSYRGYSQDPKFVMLRMESPSLRRYCMGIVNDYLDLGIDGFRIDAASDLPDEFLEEIYRAAKGRSHDIAVFGEIVPDRNFRYLEWLDGRYNFLLSNQLQKMILVNDPSVSKRWESDCRVLWEKGVYQEFFRGAEPCSDIVFLNNHDTDRLMTCSRDPLKHRLAQVFLFTWPGIPLIYYGEEVGLMSGELPQDSFERSWHDRMPMPWDESRWDHKTLENVRELIRFRKNSKALIHGGFEVVASDEMLLGYRRRTMDERVEVYVNFGEEKKEAKLESFFLKKASIVHSIGEVAIRRGKIILGPLSAAVVEFRTDTAKVRTIEAERKELLEDICSKDIEMPLPPRMLYVTLTEWCNINCLHCILNSGNSTRNGLSREAEGWLVDALAPDLPLVEYLAFVHGGENIHSPIFLDLVDRFVQARGGLERTIHLLSNGMTVFRKYAEAVEHGVNSVSISIDGLTKESNDRLRKGSHIDTVLKNLESIVNLRKNHDLRVGVATTVTRWNLGELSMLAKRLREIGIDWYKLEEVYPVNRLSAELEVTPGSPEMLEMLSEVENTLRGSHTVFCDHTDQYRWKLPCRIRKEGGTDYWAQDSFVNHADIHPCRLPYETVCVDPNGDVHSQSYMHPVSGNLARKRLIEIAYTENFADEQMKVIRRCHAEGIRASSGIGKTKR